MTSDDLPGFKDGVLYDIEAVLQADKQAAEKERHAASERGDPWAEEIEDFPPIDVGAPMPLLLADDFGSSLIFDSPANTESGVKRAWALFEGTLYSSLGYPNDEALSGHPLHGAGLRAYRAFEVHNSELVATMEERNRVHRDHRPELYESLRHVIITFHDSTLDCVCRRFQSGVFDLSFAEALQTMSSALEYGAEPPAGGVEH